jgi:hypothetical protein
MSSKANAKRNASYNAGPPKVPVYHKLFETPPDASDCYSATEYCTDQVLG